MIEVILKSGKKIHVLPQEVPILKKAGLLAKQVKQTGKTKELKTQTETK